MMNTIAIQTALGKLALSLLCALWAGGAIGQSAGFRPTGTWLVTGVNIGDHVTTFMEGAAQVGERADKEVFISSHVIPPGVCGEAALVSGPAMGRAVRRQGQGGYMVASAFKTNGQGSDHAWGSHHFLLTPNAAGDGLQGVGTIKLFRTIEDVMGDRPSCTVQTTTAYTRLPPPR